MVPATILTRQGRNAVLLGKPGRPRCGLLASAGLLSSLLACLAHSSACLPTMRPPRRERGMAGGYRVTPGPSWNWRQDGRSWGSSAALAQVESQGQGDRGGGREGEGAWMMDQWAVVASAAGLLASTRDHSGLARTFLARLAFD